MKAVVTGAAGFIGARLCRELAEQGHQVRALALPGEEVSHIQDWTDDIRRGDLTIPASLKKMANGTDVVFHLAGRVVDFGPKSLFHAQILDVTRNLIAECTGKTGRFVYVSSVAALGLGRHLDGAREDDPPKKSGVPYNDAKLEAEELVRLCHRQKEIEAVVVRPSNVIGPRSVWVTEVLRQWRKGPLPLIDGGRHSASLIHVGNLVRGLLLAGTVPVAAGRTYHFRDDWNVTWKKYLTDLGTMVGQKPSFSLPFRAAWALGAVAEALFTPLGLRPPVTRLAVGVMGRSLDVDASRARDELGWSSTISYEEAMAEIKAWLDENPSLINFN